MSHVVQLELRIYRPDLLADVARQKGYAVREQGRETFWSGRTVEGLTISLPGWRYKVVVDGEGRVHYDNYNGAWGDLALLHDLVQEYAVAVVTAEAAARGQTVYREDREDGTVVLHVGGGGW